MAPRIKKLTAKDVENKRKPGRYAAGDGVYLVVSPTGAKSWVHRYRFGGKRRREMGLGSYPIVSLAQARAAGGVNRGIIVGGDDPLELQRRKEQEEWAAKKKNLNFLRVAEDFITMKSEGDKPWWCEKRARGQRNILYNQFTPLHDLPIDSAEAADIVTLKLFEIIAPKWQTTPTMARTMKFLAYNIGRRAHALKVLPRNVANPGDEPLDVLLGQRQPEGGHWTAIEYSRVPEVYAKLEELSRPFPQDYFVVSEAARAVGLSTHMVKHAIRDGSLPAHRGEPGVASVRELVGYEWRIKPIDLFNWRPLVLNVIPGIRSVVFDLIRFCALNGPRPVEARLMRWDQYDPVLRQWRISWTETKAGEKIRRDMVIPLSDAANDIVLKMQDIQERYRMQTEYVFANYPSRFNTNSHLDQPPSNVTALENLRLALPPDAVEATMHGFRTNIRSWGEDQTNPDDTPRFHEKDLERAIGHAAGFGKTKVSRGYSRQAEEEIRRLKPIFNGWANFVTGDDGTHTTKPVEHVETAMIIPIDERRRQQGG